MMTRTAPPGLLISAALAAWIGTCLMIALPDSAAAQTGENGVNLTFAIHVQNSRLLPFEPILAHATLANTTGSSAMVPPGWADLLTFEVREAASATWTAVEQWWKPFVCMTPMPPQVLDSGSARTESQWIHPVSRERELLLRPGHTYRLRVRLKSVTPPMELVSSEVTVEVVDPPESEELALERLVTPGESRATDLLILGNIGRQGPARIVEFVARFPESHYSVYMRRSYVWRARNPVEGAEVEVGTASQYEAYLRDNAPWALPMDETGD